MHIDDSHTCIEKVVLQELIRQVLKLNIITQNAIKVIGIAKTYNTYDVLTRQQMELIKLNKILEGGYKNE